MGHRSSIDSPSKEVRRWLERALTESNSTGYAELESLLKKKGYSITRSSLQRFGCRMEQQLAQVWAATEAARLLARETGDDPDGCPTGLITLVQTGMVNTLIHLRESRENDSPFTRTKLLATASKNIATLTHVSVNLRRYQVEVRERVKHAATAAEKITRKDGLSMEAVQALYREILGVVS